MKKLLNHICLFFLVLISFGYASIISKSFINNSFLMKEIKSKRIEYEMESIDATIEGNYIIPGLNGLTVDAFKSYKEMKMNNTFSPLMLVFKEKKPHNSIDNNKDKIIKKGRKDKKMVSIIIKNNEDLQNYLIKNNIPFTRLIFESDFDMTNKYEQINIETNPVGLDNKLNKYHLNKKICIIDYSNKDKCIKDNKYLVSFTYIANNYIKLKSKIVSGDIIFLDDYYSLDDLLLLLKEVKYRDLQLGYLSNVISENR